MARAARAAGGNRTAGTGRAGGSCDAQIGGPGTGGAASAAKADNRDNGLHMYMFRILWDMYGRFESFFKIKPDGETKALLAATGMRSITIWENPWMRALV